MDRKKIDRKIGRGETRWQAPRLKEVVKNRGVKKVKKKKKAFRGKKKKQKK